MKLLGSVTPDRWWRQVLIVPEGNQAHLYVSVRVMHLKFYRPGRRNHSQKILTAWGNGKFTGTNMRKSLAQTLGYLVHYYHNSSWWLQQQDRGRKNFRNSWSQDSLRKWSQRGAVSGILYGSEVHGHRVGTECRTEMAGGKSDHLRRIRCGSVIVLAKDSRKKPGELEPEMILYFWQGFLGRQDGTVKEYFIESLIV